MNYELIGKIKDKFKEVMGEPNGAKLLFAPGRVNLIGEHIDYSGGYVFPCALTIGTYALIKPRKDRKIRLFSVNISERVFTISLDELKPMTLKSWTSYPLGVLWSLMRQGFKVNYGFDIVIGGDVPSGSGLSSSASLEVVAGVAYREIYGWDPEKCTNVIIAVAGRCAENEYVGANTGILDQFASSMGKKDSAILLDCATLNYLYAPISLEGKKIIVTNSNKPHSLVSSQYNTRRAESDKARDLLKEKDPTIINLCDISLERFYELSDVIKDPIIFKRAKHAISENQRTKDCLTALKNNDLNKFGDLVNEAGASIRYDYEATCYETDVLVDAARIQPGVLCSRQTGGGWGGCTVSIVDENYIESFKQNVEKIYTIRTEYKPTFYVVEIGDGPSLIETLWGEIWYTI